ncbi:MAG: hypothetical protein P4L28_11560 [Paludibacteraceae bacterium]|nr:hypothetical protein [Paludibacteraceae bacterium]
MERRINIELFVKRGEFPKLSRFKHAVIFHPQNHPRNYPKTTRIFTQETPLKTPRETPSKTSQNHPKTLGKDGERNKKTWLGIMQMLCVNHLLSVIWVIAEGVGKSAGRGCSNLAFVFGRKLP